VLDVQLILIKIIIIIIIIIIISDNIITVMILLWRIKYGPKTQWKRRNFVIPQKRQLLDSCGEKV
jgi:hypothetical protein